MEALAEIELVAKLPNREITRKVTE